MAAAAQRSIAPGGAISRQVARPLNAVFHGIFTESDLTKNKKIKQFVMCVVYEAGKRVGRMSRMAEANCFQEMNKAYYMRLQVLFADVSDDRSYWSRHLGFSFSFTDMMTHTVGSSSAQRKFYFDYNSNEHLEEEQIENLKAGWTSGLLWRRYNELKTEMQSTMLPVLFKCRFHALEGGDAYGTGSGATFQEVVYDFLGKLFQIDANARHEDRVRKRARANQPAGAGAGQAAAQEAADAVREEQEEDRDRDDDEGDSQVAAAAGRASVARDAPEVWGDAHVAWRHSSLFVFFLNGPLAYFHPSPGSRNVCEFLKKVPRNDDDEVFKCFDDCSNASQVMDLQMQALRHVKSRLETAEGSSVATMKGTLP